MRPQNPTRAEDPFLSELVRMQDHLYYYALQLTEDRDEALDLVQETTLKALKHRKRLNHTHHVRAWLYTILRNTRINYLRSSHNRQQILEGDQGNGLSDSPADYACYSPEAALVRTELSQILNSIPENYRTPLTMVLSGYSYKEISERMHIPLGTVKSRIHLGKKRMRHIYTS